MYSRTIATLIASLLLGNAFSVQRTPTYEDTVKLLNSLKVIKDDRQALATLFKEGDARIDDLIKALHEPDRNISLRAQIVIRYLGNQTGMKALEEWYGTQAEVVRSGPIPIPLGERDYKWIGAQSITNVDDYIYALALDSSPRARALLDEMTKKSGSVDGHMFAVQALKRVNGSEPEKLLTGEHDLAKLVLKNAFFIDPISKPHTSVRLLGLNGEKDKALVEVYINRGRLAEEWYHVVIRRCDQGWKFFSITQVAVS
jgi:hypothetical protein